jgi:hypothetical protein
MKNIISFLAAFAIAMAAHSSAFATAGASVQVSNVTCTVNTVNGSTSSAATGGRCDAVLSNGESLVMSANVSLMAFDQGLTGAPGGFFNPFPGTPGYDTGFPLFHPPVDIPPGFEFAEQQIFLGEFVDPRNCFTFTCQHTRRNEIGQRVQTRADGLPDTVSFLGVLSAFASADLTDVLPGDPRFIGVSVSIHTDRLVLSVPEPESYALMLAGLALIVFVPGRKPFHR